VIQVGATVGNYQVLQKIGAGAMGNVFLAHHPVIGKRVALKVIHPELASNEEMIARFFNEARAVTQIGHENIVDVQDFGQTPDGDSFIVMELLEGQSLGDKLKQEGPLSIPRTVHIAIQLADGLAAAHARGIIHRDLKPDNIFLIARGGDPDFVKILDFGLAKLTGPSQAMQHQTKTGSLLGTPHYMAPEQAENVKKVDHRADVYSLGCILFQLLTGRVPFPGEGFGEVLVRHVREPPPLPSRLNPAVPPALEKIVLHALAKKPDFRFSSMEDFRSALRDPERFSQTLDGQRGVSLTPGDGIPAQTNFAVGPPPPVAGMGPPPPALMAVQAQSTPRVGQDAPTMMAQAPDAETIARLAAQAQAMQGGRAPAAAGRGEPATALSDRRPDPQRVVQQKPQKATQAQPHVARREEARARRGILYGAAAAVAVFVVSIGAFLLLTPRGNVAVSIVSNPPGAEVLDGEQSLGVAPLVIKLPKAKEAHTLAFKLDGYLTAQRKIPVLRDSQLTVRMTPKQAPVDDDAAGAPSHAPAATAPGTPPAVAGTPAGASATTPGTTATPPSGTAAATAPTPEPPAARPAPAHHASAHASAEPPAEKPATAPKKPHAPKKKGNADTLILTPSF
jgi:serine/threonine-protein kinase